MVDKVFMDDRDLIIQELRDIIERQAFQITELERRLGLNSSNSSKPPSSDGLRKKPAPKSLRSKSGKKSGGQKGHKGSTLQQVSNPDTIIKYDVFHCPNCNGSLDGIPVLKYIKRQVFDIPLPSIKITQHEACIKVCSCGCKVKGIFPQDVKAPVQYGARIQALAPYLMHQQMIPEDRLSLLFKDVFDLDITSSSLVRMGKNLSFQLKSWAKDQKNHLQCVPVQHLDETGFRIGGNTRWLHVQSTALTTRYRGEEKRGNIPKDLTGVVVHDHFKSYYSQLNNVKHGLCNAHHLRELKALEEIEKEHWAFKMSKLLRFSNKHQDPPLERISALYDRIVNYGLAYHEALTPLKSGSRGRKKRRTGHNLLIRLRDYKSDVLRFLSHKDVPFTNNLAEQDIRMMKVKQKISGGFRTFKGAEVFCILRSFFSTCRKRNKNIFQSISLTLQGQNPISF